jgi:hypothetical protein
MSSVKKKIFYEKVKFRARLVNTNLNDDKLKLKYFETNLNDEQFNYYILLYYSILEQEEENSSKSKINLEH